MKTIVRSIRISEELWKKSGKVAEAQGKSRNSVLVELISKYCAEKNTKIRIDKAK